MSESRDRLKREMDHAQVFLRRRSEGILEDQQSIETTPIARMTTTTTMMTAAIRRPTTGGMRGNNSSSSSRSPIGLNRENTPSRRSRVRGRNSILPIWYPRTPLRDVTAVVRAIERTRARLRDVEGQRNESRAPQKDGASNSGGDHFHVDEHNKSFISSVPKVGKVPKILLGVTNHNDGGSETPQKRLLNSIDKVEKEVLEELQKLKKTPSAKRAEREKRVRTLMSMR